MSGGDHPTFRVAVAGRSAAGDDSLTRQGVDVRCVPRPNGEGRLVFRTTAGPINMDLQFAPAEADALVIFFDPASLEAIDAAAEIAKAHPGLPTAMCAKRPTASGDTLSDYGFKATALLLLRSLTAVPALEFAPPAAGPAARESPPAAWAEVARRGAAL